MLRYQNIKTFPFDMIQLLIVTVFKMYKVVA